MLIQWHDPGPIAKVLQNAIESAIFETLEPFYCVPACCPASDCDTCAQAADKNYRFVDLPEQ